ncbi:Hypothetical protein FKW44_022784 [Caligus rogercresseyi]|uniref:Uncharacterized protein n=1 Tax=Caligus rogercresseyi TaxID=217165 RepID=A0A7T8GMY9_CALRO|nr:Hypothetical protein FKW44_022784 [Caligus rogercresseyi]
MVWAGVTSDGKKGPNYLCRGGREDRPGGITCIFFQRRSSHGYKESILRLFYCSTR